MERRFKNRGRFILKPIVKFNRNDNRSNEVDKGRPCTPARRMESKSIPTSWSIIPNDFITWFISTTEASIRVKPVNRYIHIYIYIRSRHRSPTGVRKSFGLSLQPDLGKLNRRGGESLQQLRPKSHRELNLVPTILK